MRATGLPSNSLSLGSSDLSVVKVSLLVGVWYAASSFCSVSSAFYLRNTDRDDSAIYLCISLLTLSQCLACFVGQWLQDLNRKQLELKDLDGRSPNLSRSGRFVGLLHFITTWTMNLAMAYSSLACANSIRGLEPVLAAMLTWTYGSQGDITWGRSHYASIIVIVAGVWLATWQDGSCRNVVFLLAGMSAALCNVYRNVLIQAHRGSTEDGFLFSAFASSSVLSLTAVSASLFHISPQQADLNQFFELFSSPWLFAAGAGSMLYNTASIRVCVVVSLVTHSLLTVCKRPFSILTGAAVTTGISSHMVSGNALTAIGLYLYTVRSTSRSIQLILFFLAGMLFISGITQVEKHISEWTPFVAHSFLPPSLEGRTQARLPLKLSGEARTRLGLLFPLDANPAGNYSENLKRSGNNFGNRVWWQGTLSLFDHDAVEIKNVFLPKQGPFDVALFSTANILWNQTNYITHLADSLLPFIERLTEVLQELEGPLLVVGLGSNGFLGPTDEFGSFYTDLQPEGHLTAEPAKEHFAESFRKLLSTIESHSRKFFVRGAYTAAACHAQGYTKAMAMGCPSLFINPDLRLGHKLETAYRALRNRVDDENFRFILTLPGNFQSQTFTMMLNILTKYPQSVIVIQDDRDRKNLVRARQNITSVPASTHILAETQQRYFTSVSEWQDFYYGFDAVFGWRVHGAMVGIAAVIPSMLIAPDMRVLELAEAMLIPSTTPFDPALSVDMNPIQYMADKITFDGKAFDHNRRQIAQVYAEEFLAAGLQPSTTLLSLINDV